MALKVYINGTLYDKEDAKISVYDHGLLYGDGVFEGLPNPFEGIRYHSLAIDADSMPEELEVTAKAESGVIMGVRHRTLPVEGVQFHPESIVTAVGHDLLRNFLHMEAAGEGASRDP